MGDHNNTSRLFHTAMLRVLLIAAFVATAFGQLAPHVPDKASPWSWDNCGTKLDRLETDKVSVSGKFVAGNKLTVTASGMTNLHVPLDTGAWQVRVYETGMPKSVSTNVGDLMKALKFTDAKNTTFSMTIQFDMPKKQASGEFNANLVATDLAKSDYLCLDIKYKLAAKKPINLGASCESITSQDSCDKNSACTWCKAAAVPSKCYSKEDAKKLPPGVFACDSSLALMAPAPPAPKPTPLCFHEEDTEDHKCFEACNAEGKKFSTKGIENTGKCPGKYNTVDTTKTVLQCPDGVTNVRYCAATALNVTIATKGEAGEAMLVATRFGASCESITSQDSCDKNSAYTWCKVAAVPSKCYSKEDAKKLPPGVFACDSSLALMAPAPPAPKPTPLCFHEEDTEDHKCFEACNAEGKKFSTKGIENTGKC